MQRRRLWATAGALSASAFAITVGLGANFGLFGITEPDSTVGRLQTHHPAVAVGPRGVGQTVAVTPGATVPRRSVAPDD